MVDQDAWYWRVRYAADGKYLGIALGLVDGRSMLQAPDDGPDRNAWFSAGPAALARRLADSARDGTLRTEWAQDAVQYVITPAELLTVARSEPYSTGELVFEAEV